MSYFVCIALNGTISDSQIPLKTKDVLDWIRKKYKNPSIQFQGKLQDPSKETRMLSVFAAITEDEDIVNSHMLPSPFDEEVYGSPILVLATENDEEDAYFPQITSYISIRAHEYETLYQEWTFAVDEDEDEIVETEDNDDDDTAVGEADVPFEDLEEDAPVVRSAPVRAATQVHTRDVFVDCAIREKVIDNFSNIPNFKEYANELEIHMLRNVVDAAKKEGYEVDWSNRTFWNMYRNRAISLYVNLKGLDSYVQNDNNLLGKIKSGELTVKAVAEMGPTDLCPSRWKDTVDKIMETEKKLYSAQKNAAIIMWCSSCKKKTKCDYYQLQTRSADEPMTTFVNCIECGKRWKF